MNLFKTKKYIEALSEAASTGQTLSRFNDNSQIYIKTSSGKIPIQISVSYLTIDDDLYIQVIVQDITEQINRQRKLSLQAEAMENAGVGITISEGREEDLELTYVNEHFVEMTGYTKNNTLGKNCRFLQGRETSEETVDKLSTAINNEEEIRTIIRNYKDNGEMFWNELKITPFKTENGTRYIGIQKDVTKERRENQLISIFNRVFRHNIRNEMTVIKGMAERIDHEYSQVIMESANDLLSISEKINGYSKMMKDSGDAAEINIYELIEESIDSVNNRFGKGQEFSTTGDDFTIQAKPYLSIALEELIENSVKHSDNPKIEIETQYKNNSVTVSITDNAGGIENMNKIPLQDTSETPLQHSTGVGLWLVTWIISDHGGNIDVRDTEEGSEITVTLPKNV